jgi:sigma54-dependent transcription regulator
MSEIIKEAEKIVGKEKITQKDFDEFEKIASRLRTEREITLYSFLQEVMFQRSVELTDK